MASLAALHRGKLWRAALFTGEADVKLRPLFGRYGVESGHHLLRVSFSAFDPNRTCRDLPALT